MDLDDWYRQARTLRIEGHALSVVDVGEGPATTLLIHGFPTASIDWQPIAPALLGAGQRLIAPDLLGFGRSDKPPTARYSIRLQADLIEGLLGALGVRRVHLLAHDYGDTVAQELLARHNEGAPIELLSVCFLNGGLFPETHRPRWIQRLLASRLGPWIVRRYSRQKFGAAMRGIFGAETPPDERELDILWGLIEYNNGRAVFPKLIGYMAERRRERERWVGALLSRSVPIQLINGSADPISGAHMVARYRELDPAIDVTELAAIGHYPQLESPAQVAAAYLRFRR